MRRRWACTDLFGRDRVGNDERRQGLGTTLPLGEGLRHVEEQRRASFGQDQGVERPAERALWPCRRRPDQAHADAMKRDVRRPEARPTIVPPVAQPRSRLVGVVKELVNRVAVLPDSGSDRALRRRAPLLRLLEPRPLRHPRRLRHPPLQRRRPLDQAVGDALLDFYTAPHRPHHRRHRRLPGRRSRYPPLPQALRRPAHVSTHGNRRNA
jgi:hypothetical protein